MITSLDSKEQSWERKLEKQDWDGCDMGRERRSNESMEDGSEWTPKDSKTKTEV